MFGGCAGEFEEGFPAALEVIDEGSHGADVGARFGIMTGDEAEVSGVSGVANEISDGGACCGEGLEFAAADEQVERSGGVECGGYGFRRFVFSGEAKIEEDAFLGIDLVADFAEVFEAVGEVCFESGVIVEECSFGGGADFASEEDLVGVNVVVSAAAEELELEGNGAEGEEVGNAEWLVVRGDWRFIGPEEYGGRDGGFDGGEPFGALGAAIEDDMFLFAEDIAPFVWEPGFGGCGYEDDASAGVAVLGFGLAERGE